MKKSHENIILASIVAVFFLGLALWNDLGGVRSWIFPGPNQAEILAMPFYDGDQQELSLEKLEGQPLVVNFWATWCPVCVEEMASLNAFAKAFEAKGGKMVAISNDQGSPAKIRAFYKQNGYENLTVYIDPRSSILAAMGGRGLPTAALISPSGEILGLIEGGFDWTGDQARELVKKHFDIDLDNI